MTSAIYIPWSWFEPLPEWARLPLVLGAVATFLWVVLWAIRQQRKNSPAALFRGTRMSQATRRGMVVAVVVGIAITVAVVILDMSM